MAPNFSCQLWEFRVILHPGTYSPADLNLRAILHPGTYSPADLNMRVILHPGTYSPADLNLLPLVRPLLNLRFYRLQAVAYNWPLLSHSTTYHVHAGEGKKG